ncbi:hypothetical protein I551_5939 [Mycobacterium ulcerans str. Harvey]|uniref:Uncharacterized protein n=1 Tax=Mycobacterium ulcerans str. Harvey TaxID=1299332 RepID=A0ABN0QSA3_MYCUL|nr:hypothetical protein I551_5939 [Mycobacterium ulcerans str. Harvey]
MVATFLDDGAAAATEVFGAGLRWARSRTGPPSSAPPRG